MKLFRKKITVAVAGAMVFILFALGIHHSYKQAALHIKGHSASQVTGSTKASSMATAALTPSPSISPAPTVIPSAKGTPVPSPSTRYLDVKDGPCQGIHGADPGCVQKNSSFIIASANLWPQQGICNATSATVTFNPMTVTRHYMSGGGGTATVQVDYSDGSSSPVIPLTFTSATDVQTYNGLTHTFPKADGGYKYRVRVISPNAITIDWMSVQSLSGCRLSSPSPTPYFP